MTAATQRKISKSQFQSLSSAVVSGLQQLIVAMDESLGESRARSILFRNATAFAKGFNRVAEEADVGENTAAAVYIVYEIEDDGTKAARGTCLAARRDTSSGPVLVPFVIDSEE